MELAAGTKLGPYEIQRKLGAGGMGVVYRAIDGRLGRAVAIKVLPAHMKGEPERLKRFEREARTVGGLNHPNLVTLFDVGAHEEVPFLVTELLDGQSLRDKLRDGRLPPREAVRIAGEIARGLAAAHGAGITHRDIKPENIFVMADDRVKVLDFGIAKLADDTADAGSASTLAGVGPATAHTGTGMVIGTPGYMAPEQLGGGAVGPRTDIFALGVVLHEMLAGRRPFAAVTDDGQAPGIEESYAILKQVPTELPTNVPPAIARVVRRCLEKRPEARFQSASDLAFALGDVVGDSASDLRAQSASEQAVAETMAQPAITDVPPRTVKTLPGAAVAVVALPTSPDANPTPPAQPATTQPLATLGARHLGPWILGSVLLVVLGGVAIAWFLRGAPRAPVAAATPGRTEGHWPDLVPGGAEYRRVTFLPQPITFARFAGDHDDNVLWSLRRTDSLWHVTLSSIATPSMIDQVLNGRLLDVSNHNELALRNKGDGAGGSLERGRQGMGAPQFVTDHVEEAAWDQKDALAILRATPTGIALEYPIDKVLLAPRTTGLAMLRMSRDGNFIAVVETDAPPLTSGHVAIIDTAGKPIARSAAYAKIDGVAWTYHDEVWFSEGTTLHALRRDGRERVLLRGVLPIAIKDVAHDDRILAAPRQVRARTVLGPPNGDLKNVGWFDGSEVTSISRDGGVIVFIESTGPRDASGFAAFRRTGTELPVSIGRAFGLALLPDASATIAVTGLTTPLRVVPTDARPATELPLGEIAQFDVADRPAIAWSGKYLVVRAAANGKRMRLWRYDLAQPTAPPTPIGPEVAPEGGTHPISSDGKWVALVDRGQGIRLVSTTGEPDKRVVLDAKRAAAGKDESTAIGFSDDDASLFVMALHEYPREIDRLDLATGTKVPITTLAPEDKPQLMSVALDATAATIAYSLIIETSEVYVIAPPVGAAPPP